MESSLNESYIILALQAFKTDPKLSVQMAVQIYKVSYMTLTRCYNGNPFQTETIIKSQKLSNLKKKTIIQKIFKLEF